MAFTATNKAPGVYIDEIQLPGPIAGVGTSTAAFVGPAQMGPISEPRLLTNPTEFQNIFGGYITGPMVYVTHAVRGFFDNGGTTCYFVRVGTAARSSRSLRDGSGGAGRNTLVVRAKQEGVAGDAITVEVQDASIVAAVAAVRAQATLSAASNNQATVTAAADAANFRPGDIVFLEQGGTNERATIDSISGATVTFRANLNSTYSGGNVRIADLEPGQTRIRVANTIGIEPGSSITISQSGGSSESRVVQSVERVNHFVTLAQSLANTYTMTSAANAVNIQTLEFTLIIRAPGAGAESFTNLSMDPRHSRYFAAIVNSVHVDVTLADPPTVTPPPNNRPRVLAASPLQNGQEDNISQIQPQHYKAGIDALKKVDEVNILCVPDRTDQEIQQYMIDHCAEMQDRFAVLDSQPNVDVTGVRTQRGNLTSERGHAALYYPWIVIADPTPAGGQIKVPPSGHVAGVYARTDNDRGVHKAPANEPVRRALALERTLDDVENGLLNEGGINVIRRFPGFGFRVWGARTIATSTQWRYVNVRRLLLFIEESIQEATQFAVFEPNDLALWQKVKRQVTGFLTRVWQSGALFGATAEQAFRVRVDEELNPPEVRALGQLVIEVIVVPTTPAEFIVFRIIQDPTGAVLQEQ